MSLIADSPWALQSMLDLVSAYAFKWRYSLNPLKSQILILNMRSSQVSCFQWQVCGHTIPIVDSAKHLGILISSSPSTIGQTTNAITSSRSAFYAPSAVSARQTGINPCTSILLYKALLLSILTFGLDVWSPSLTELRMMDRSQAKILRTILGLPSHVPIAGMHLIAGTLPIHLVAMNKQLIFVRNTLALSEDATPRRLLLLCVHSSFCPPSSIVHSFISSLDTLPSIHSGSSFRVTN